MSDKLRKQATEYLESIREDSDSKVDLTELEDAVEDAERRMESFSQEHGEDHKLTQKAQNLVSQRREELSRAKKEAEKTEDLRRGLIERVADEFEFNEEWLEAEIAEAVTHALYGVSDGRFAVGDDEIKTPEDLESIDPFEQIEREEVVVLLAKDALGRTSTVEQEYERLSKSKSFNAFEVLTENGPSEVSEVADLLGEDQSKVGNWLKNPIHRSQALVPFYRPSNGVYALSTAGRYFAEHYYDGGSTSKSEDSEEEIENKEPEEDDGKSPEEQTLNSFGSEGGEQNDSEPKTEDTQSDSRSDSDSEDLSEIEDTDKKAEEMFADVSEN